MVLALLLAPTSFSSVFPPTGYFQGVSVEGRRDIADIRKKGDKFYCTFRFQGHPYYFAVGQVSEQQALAKGVEVDETLGLIERGRLEVPEDVALEDFVAAGDQQDRPVVGLGRGSGRRLLQYNASPTSIWQLLIWKSLNVDRSRDHHTVRLLSVINLVCVGDLDVSSSERGTVVELARRAEPPADEDHGRTTRASVAGSLAGRTHREGHTCVPSLVGPLIGRPP